MGIQVYFKEGNVSRSLLVATKDKDNITQKSGVIYRYMGNRLECVKEYKGESAKTPGERLKGHFRAPFPMYDDANTSGHHTSLENFSILGRESHNITRIIKEAMYIRVNDSSLNRNTGRYQLSYMWDEVLFNTQDPQLQETFPHHHLPLHMAHTASGARGMGLTHYVN